MAGNEPKKGATYILDNTNSEQDTSSFIFKKNSIIELANKIIDKTNESSLISVKDQKNTIKQSMLTLLDILSSYTDNIDKLNKKIQATFVMEAYGDYDKKMKASVIDPLKASVNDFETLFITLDNILKNLTALYENSPERYLDKFLNDITFDSIKLQKLNFIVFSHVIELTYMKQFKYDNLLGLNDRINTLQEKEELLRDKLNKDSKDTTYYLNQQGLCQSFDDRSVTLKDESDKWLWGIGITTLLIIGSLLFFGLSDYDKLNIDNINYILKKHIFFIPHTVLLFWLLWFSLKKHLYYARLADDYNYKNDISKAYYGYKNEILPNDKNLLPKLDGDALNEVHTLRLKLLDNVLAIITKNPVDSGLKTDTSPYTEIISKLLDQVKKTNKI